MILSSLPFFVRNIIILSSSFPWGIFLHPIRCLGYKWCLMFYPVLVSLLFYSISLFWAYILIYDDDCLFHSLSSFGVFCTCCWSLSTSSRTTVAYTLILHSIYTTILSTFNEEGKPKLPFYVLYFPLCVSCLCQSSQETRSLLLIPSSFGLFSLSLFSLFLTATTSGSAVTAVSQWRVSRNQRKRQGL